MVCRSSPWANGRQLLWDIMVVDSLAPSKMSPGSVCKPRTASSETKNCKTKKKDLINDGNNFQQKSFEAQDL